VLRYNIMKSDMVQWCVCVQLYKYHVVVCSTPTWGLFFLFVSFYLYSGLISWNDIIIYHKNYKSIYFKNSFLFTTLFINKKITFYYFFEKFLFFCNGLKIFFENKELNTKIKLQFLLKKHYQFLMILIWRCILLFLI
jgi:hypothetical protein